MPFVRRSGHADLPLHVGVVPKWLSDRMRDLGSQIIEAMVLEYGQKEVLSRLSDPLWFQSFGAVLGMDWHSSGITTSVMYALKRGLNPRAKELGLCVCGGRGKYSRKTPEELLYLADHTGLDGDALVRASKLSAKIDSTAVQDGFSLYQHNFILSNKGDWVVVQQGMNTETKTARRYHWSSSSVKSFVEEPHSGVTGENLGNILNLTAKDADSTRSGILSLSQEKPSVVLNEISSLSKLGLPEKITKEEKEQLELFSDSKEISKQEISVLTEENRNCTMPSHHEVLAEDVDLKRLGGVLATAYESKPENFESLLLTPGLGARTLQSLTLVSEVIHGTPTRFSDPARFSFAHGGKDGHPFPVPLKIYDESIRILGDSIEKAKLGYDDKSECLKRLHKTALQIEEHCAPEADFDAAIAWEKKNSKAWNGKTV